MITEKKNELEHFTHPGHQLVKVIEGSDDIHYNCDGCKTTGTGTRYSCRPCDFDLHECCATCPTVLFSFMHPTHGLNLVTRKPQAKCQNYRACDVCAEPVMGLFYRCKDCEFDVHPLCTQLPQNLHHVLHSLHALTLQPSTSSWCMVCGGLCSTSWVYGCKICNFNIHVDCVVLKCDTSSKLGSSDTSRSTYNPDSMTMRPYYAYPAAHGVPVPVARKKTSKFAIVMRIALGVAAHVIFGC